MKMKIMKKGCSVLAAILVVTVMVAALTACGGGGILDDGGLLDGVEKTSYNVGETAEIKGVKVTLLDVIENEGIEYFEPEEGNVFVLCEFEIENTSDEEISVSSMLSFEAYCDGYSCSLSISALSAKENKEQLDGSIAAGKKMKGVVGYEISADWTELEITYTPDILSDSKVTFVAYHD